MLATMPAFPTTRWSLIAGSGDAPASRAAWTELAQAYRPPIMAYFRARFGPSVAEDLTQAFFAESIEGAWWSRADPAQGGFRTYLRTLLHRFGARHVARMGITVGVEAPEAVDDAPTPDMAYERHFARTLVARALASVESGLAAVDRSLWPFVLERGEPGAIGDLAAGLSMTPDALRQRLHRLRMRVAQCMRAEVLSLTAEPDRVEEELRAIRELLQAQ